MSLSSPAVGFSTPRRRAAFSIIEVLMSLGILSLSIAVIIPRLTATKRQAIATAMANNLKQFATAFDVYAQERGAFPAETEPGVVPPEMEGRISSEVWTRITPMGGMFNWDNNQMHYGTRYRAAIQISATSAAPLPQDIEVWEALDRTIDDGDLTTGNFRLGSGNEPIFIVAP
jgi:type II secretory pathway pseudopilin PulG